MKGKKKGGKYLRKIPNINLWPLHTLTHTHTLILNKEQLEASEMAQLVKDTYLQA